MAEAASPASGRTGAPCATCGEKVPVHPAIPATFCMECGCCVLNLDDGGALPPLVMPQILEEGAWRAIPAVEHGGDRIRPREARLVFVPFHEWEPDTGRRRLVRDARGPLSPAADLLPAGLRPPRSPRGDDVRGLSLAGTAHRGRLADPRTALDLIRRGETVDVMLPPAHPAPAGAAGGSRPRVLYYPFWLLTFAVDHVERAGVVDATSGRPVGPSLPPRRWRPALEAALGGGAAFLAAWSAASLLLSPPWSALTAGALSWAVAAGLLTSSMLRERGR